LQRHRGLSDEVVAFFTHVGTDGQSPGAALRARRRVVVRDVATDKLCSAAAREVLTRARLRSVQSTPMLAPSGDCTGVVTTRHAEPGRTPTDEGLVCLDRIGHEGGAWLAWHTRLSTLDALEYLHRHARESRQERPDGR
jgi:hypothetical protein